MIYVEDNFLPQDQFLALRDTISRRYVPGINNSKNTEQGYESQRLTWHDQNADWKEGCKFLGVASIPAIEKIIDTLKSQTIDPVNYSVWFAYTFNNTGVIAHLDGPLRYSNREHTYTTLLYTSDWQSDWGGELVFGHPIPNEEKKLIKIDPYKVIDPIPNRMVIFSRDQAHEVRNVIHPDPSFCRMALGAGWSSTIDTKRYKIV
jgi:Rps23 Pro-64 3,4-dihydroxylase Tpa1-like proline 4-hydroxylase